MAQAYKYNDYRPSAYKSVYGPVKHKPAFGKKERELADLTKSFNEATGSGAKGKAGYSRMTEDEREKWKVEHGIAPTSADPSAIGVATRAAAKSAHARGELSEKDKRSKKIITARGLDKDKYDAYIEAARARRGNKSSIEKKTTPGAGIVKSSVNESNATDTTTPTVSNVGDRIRDRIRSRKLGNLGSNTTGFDNPMFSANLLPNTINL